MKKDNFTINTIALFRKWYPNIKLVLSTWKNNLTDEEKDILKQNNCFLIESDQFSEEYKGKNEKYIAPLYNYMIQKGMDVTISIVDKNKVHVLGTPEELEIFIKE